MLAIALSAAFLAGIALALTRDASSASLAPLVVVLVLGLGAVWSRPAWRWTAALLLVGALGALRAAVGATPPLNETVLSSLAGQQVDLAATVGGAPQLRGQAVAVRLDVQSVAAQGGSSIPVGGSVQLWTRADGVGAGLGYGDAVMVRGTLSPPPSEWAEMLWRQGYLAEVAFPPDLRVVSRSARLDPFQRVRDEIARGFERVLPRPHALLAFGMLFGGSGLLGPELQGALRASGLGHLVAVSGYNLVFVAGALVWASRRLLGARWALLPALAGVVAYTLLAGAPPSAVRAALMVAGALIAARVGRLADPLTGVLMAAALMSAVSPPVLLDVGFQLSVAATLGLVLLAPRITRLLSWLPRPMGQALAVAFAAQLATLPISLAVFQQTSVISPLANLLAAPLVPLIMAGAGVLVVLLPVPALADVGAAIVWVPTYILVELVRVMARLPGAVLTTGRLPMEAALLASAVLLLWGTGTLAAGRVALSRTISQARVLPNLPRRRSSALTPAPPPD